MSDKSVLERLRELHGQMVETIGGSRGPIVVELLNASIRDLASLAEAIRREGQNYDDANAGLPEGEALAAADTTVWYRWAQRIDGKEGGS